MLKYLIVFAALLGLSGCFTSTQPSGLFYTEAKNPILATTDTQSNREGVACSEGVLGFLKGDSSIDAAKREGNITSVSSVDSSYKNVLWIYVKQCTIVKGS
ncbi:TRL-like family protein [Candidatus Hepatincolaceae symbiont of Richtersius coronifer]